MPFYSIPFSENTQNLASCDGVFALKMVSIIIVLVSLKNNHRCITELNWAFFINWESIKNI